MQLETLDFAYTRDIQRIEAVINGWVTTYQLKHADTNFSLSAADATIMLTEAPEVEESELTQAMRWKLKDSSEIDIKNHVIDCFSIPGQRERGRQAMVYVVAARSDLLKHYVRIMERCQLNLRSIDIATMAQRNLASLLVEDRSGVALLQLEPSSGLLTISREANLYLAREIEIDRHLFSTEALQAASSPIKMNDEVQAALEHITLEVQRSLDYFERYFALAPIQTLVTTPFPLEIEGANEFLSAQLGIKVYGLNLQDFIRFNAKVQDKRVEAKHLPAIGAALRYSQLETGS